MSTIRIPDKGHLWSLTGGGRGRWAAALGVPRGRLVRVRYSGLRDANNLSEVIGTMLTVCHAQLGGVAELLVIRRSGLADYAISLAQISTIELQDAPEVDLGH